ncbi:MAG: hypothetical protein AAFZ65_16085, partial [Planctomycetota bacterium]
GSHVRWLGAGRAGRDASQRVGQDGVWSFSALLPPGDLVLEGWIDGVRVDTVQLESDTAGQPRVRLEAKVD